MHYTYVLLSDWDWRFYTGSTGGLDARVRRHNHGRVRSTAHPRPLRLIYYEACIDPDDARRRERLRKIRKGKALPDNPARRISGRDLGRHVPVQQVGTVQVGTALVGDVQ